MEESPYQQPTTFVTAAARRTAGPAWRAIALGFMCALAALNLLVLVIARLEDAKIEVFLLEPTVAGIAVGSAAACAGLFAPLRGRLALYLLLCAGTAVFVALVAVAVLTLVAR